ncbi:MAG: D-glycero-beta-D-manno-heptose-7-phosphate kinase [Verrucomicrobiae bacterium]|nr:D-glycero-beta-D-manno-heptose-7-phosphate kinase [Verrucomicrobiae bacterium]
MKQRSGPTSVSRVREIWRRVPRLNVLVVGDVMLDRFIWGHVRRISPEAPVPVVEVTRENSYPGGAANVARNIRALGARCAIIGLRGADRAGEELQETLRRFQIDTAGLFTDEQRPTTVKTRIIAHQQQVVRFDHESTRPVSARLATRILEYYRSILPQVDAVIFEDYAKGLLSPSLLTAMQRDALRVGKITAADPNPRQVLPYDRLTVITPNRQEAFAAAGLPYAEPTEHMEEDRALLEVGRTLLRKWRPQYLLITLGEHGMCLFQNGAAPLHIPTVAREVFDVSGAGDTVVATLTLALAANANAVEAAEISNHAAGVVVGKLGTATCSPDELLASFRENRTTTPRWITAAPRARAAGAARPTAGE